jgi:Chaperone of endosialidase
LEQASEVIYGLKPVSFRYKAEIEPTRLLSFGLIAEEVEEVSPDLITPGSDGQVNSVRYDAVNAMLLNEFLKEHIKVQEQGITIAELKNEIATLAATVKEQAAQIQRVSAQIETIQRTSQLVCNRK